MGMYIKLVLYSFAFDIILIEYFFSKELFFVENH
jgi:hypothetical protein